MKWKKPTAEVSLLQQPRELVSCPVLALSPSVAQWASWRSERQGAVNWRPLLHLGPVYASLSPGSQNTEVSVFWALSRCPLSRSRQNHFKPQPKSSVDARYAAPDVRGMAVSWVGCNNCRTPPLAFPFTSIFSPLPLDISVILLGSSWPK